MGRPRSASPRLLWHSAAKQYYVRLSGKIVYLGADQQRAEGRHRREVAEWLLQGGPGQAPAPGKKATPGTLTVAEVLLAYRESAAAKVSVSQVARIDRAIEATVDLYGSLAAGDFDQLALDAVRQTLLRTPSRRQRRAKVRRQVGRPRRGQAKDDPQRILSVMPGEPPSPLSRRYVNHLVGCIQTAWAWAAERKLVSGQAAVDVASLQRLGRQEGGREVPRVLPVDPDVVARTLSQLHPTIASMVRLQQLTGMRPGEVVLMRRCDISCSPAERIDFTQDETVRKVSALAIGETVVWVYVPHKHKTERKGKARLVAIGPKAQAVLLPFFEDRAADAYLFSPREVSDSIRLALGREASYASSRRPGEHYTTQSYAEAIDRACRAAGLPHWCPNQLRHNRATEINEQYDLHTAAATLGHARPDVTTIYALEALGKAARAAAEIG